MPALSAGDELVWRSHPYSYKGYLWMHAPTAIFKARVNQAVFTYPLIQVTFDTVTLGAFGDISPGMTVAFGDSEGGFNLGVQRVRKAATSTILYFGEASQGTSKGDVNLADNMYITVYNERRLWAIPQYIDYNTSIIYKDRDRTLIESGRNYGDFPGPIANCGTGWAGFVNTSTLVATVQFDGTRSFAGTPGSTISTYLWDVDDGTITVGTTGTSTITATFPAGFRYVSLTVTDSDGYTHTAYAPVFAADTSTYAPIEDFEISSHELTPTGATLRLTVYQSLPRTIPDGCHVIYWEEERYGDGSTDSLAGPEGYERIKFVGWHNGNVLQAASDGGYLLSGVEIECLTGLQKLGNRLALPIRVASDSTPTIWGEIDTLTIRRLLQYLFQWHSTALDLMDLYISDVVDIADAPIPGIDLTSENLLSQALEAANAGAFQLTCDQRGWLRVQRNRDYSATGGSPATITTLTADDLARIDIVYNDEPTVAWVRMFAISTADSNPYFAIAPGLVPGQGGRRESVSIGFVVGTNPLKESAGTYYVTLNNNTRSATFVLIHVGDVGFDPAVDDYVNLTISSTYLPRGQNYTDAVFRVIGQSIRHLGNGVKEVTLQVVPQSSGYDGYLYDTTIAS